MARAYDHAATRGLDTGGVRERTARWAVLIVVAAVVLGPLHVPYAPLLIVPVLVWSALRAPLRELITQLVLVAATAGVTTWLDRGPFAADHLADKGTAAPWWAAGLFVVACVAATLPLAIGHSRQSSAQRRAEEAQLWTDTILDGVGDIAVLSLDPEGVIEVFNPGAQRILGYEPAEVVGRTLRMFQTDEEVSRLAEQLGCPPRHDAIIAALSERSTGPVGERGLEVQVTGKDDEPHTLSLAIAPVVDSEGTLLGRVATASDVTERAQAQESLDEVIRMEREAKERLSDIERAKETFVSSVSHELRTPITNIVGYLEMLADGMYGPLSGEQMAAHERIGQNSKRLLTLIDDLLTMSSVEDLGVALADVELDLREVVQRSQEVFRPGLHGRQLKLDVVLPDEPVLIHGDPDHLERLITNLVRNAVKFTPDGGSISVYLRGRSPWWCLEVADTGMGIPDEDLPMVFNRFHRASNSEGAAIQGS
ncbi:MAG TPA: histidine kinase dimerization/phospho-acceptor domain-containing protein, partial [Marmoricola sp.]